MERVYIVVPTTAIGGAEKRFLGLFARLAPEDERVWLVASERLLELASGAVELRALSTLGRQIVTFGAERAALPRAVARALARAPRAVVHDVLVPPPLAHPFPLRRVVFTVPLSGVNLLSRVGRAALYAGALAARRVDFLDRGVRDHVARRLPFMEGRFSVTPGSFVDADVYAGLPARKKDARVQFVGLFSQEKQAFRLVEQLPEIDRSLRARGRRVAFRLAGREIGDEPELGRRVDAIAGEVDVVAGFDPDPRDALARSRVFLSLQRNTNYPSKALLEALACGALPVITDVADSRRMVPEGVAEWIPRDFAAADVARAVDALLALSDEEHDRRVARIRDHLAQHFSFRAMADYYHALWDAAAGVAS